MKTRISFQFVLFGIFNQLFQNEFQKSASYLAHYTPRHMSSFYLESKNFKIRNLTISAKIESEGEKNNN